MSQPTLDAAGRRAIALEYYDTATLVFHWLTALLVVVLFGTSWAWNVFVPHDYPRRHVLEAAHISFGILFAALIVVRAVWRWTGSRHIAPVPGLPGVLSRIMYTTLYTLMALDTVTGFVLRWVQGEEFSFFGLFSIPNLIGRNRAFEDPVHAWHNWIAWAIIILAAGHACAALVHHYVLKDKVLERMLFHRRQSV